MLYNGLCFVDFMNIFVLNLFCVMFYMNNSIFNIVNE